MSVDTLKQFRRLLSEASLAFGTNVRWQTIYKVCFKKRNSRIADCCRFLEWPSFGEALAVQWLSENEALMPTSLITPAFNFDKVF